MSVRQLTTALAGVVRLLARAIPTILGIVVLNFALLRFVPGDAADAIAGEAGSATRQSVAALREHLGLDLPFLDQLVAYLDNLAHVNLGMSARYNVPVTALIADRLPATLLLMLVAFVLALSIGTFLGVVMAAWARRPADRIVSAVAILLYSVPSFWIGLMLIVLFSVTLGWLPSGGIGPAGTHEAGIAALLSRLRYLALPASSLALFYVGIYARLTRTAMIEVASLDFVRTAAAKGLAPLGITLHHVLRNALIPVTTVAGVHLGGMLGGSVVVETVFGWPGLGRLAFEAVTSRDYKVLLGILLASSLAVIVMNATVDVVQKWLDPRIAARS